MMANSMCALQYGLDSTDINKAENKAGTLLGKFQESKTAISDTALQPYSEVFGLQRFRENELIHGRCAPISPAILRERNRCMCCPSPSLLLILIVHCRWAMLAALGVIVAEASTGISW